MKSVNRAKGARAPKWAIPGLTAAGLAPLIVVLAAPASAWASETWQFNAATQQLVISLPRGVTPRYALVAEPARIVLDLPQTELAAATQQHPDGAVRQIRAAQFQPDLARIVLELSPEAVLTPGQVELQPLAAGSTDAVQRWALRPLVANGPTPTANITAASPEASPGFAPNLDLPASPEPQPTASAQNSVEPPQPPAESPAPAPDGPSENLVEEPAANPVANPDVTPAASPSPAPPPVAPSLGPVKREPVATAPAGSTTAPALALLEPPPLEPGAVAIPVELPVQSETAQTETAQTPEPASAATRENPTAPVSSTIPHLPAAAFPATAPAVAVLPAPLPVSLSTPLSASGELEQATGTAATLTAPIPGAPALSVSSQPASRPAATSVIPSTGTLSFPTPTAIAVNVPDLSTVPQAVEPAAEPNQAEPNQASNQAEPNPAGSTPGSNRRPDSRAERRHSRQQATRPARSGPEQPQGQSLAQQTPPDQNPAVQPAVPFGHPIPDTAPAPQTASVPIIPFGQPLPQ